MAANRELSDLLTINRAKWTQESHQSKGYLGFNFGFYE